MKLSYYLPLEKTVEKSISSACLLCLCVTLDRKKEVQLCCVSSCIAVLHHFGLMTREKCHKSTEPPLFLQAIELSALKWPYFTCYPYFNTLFHNIDSDLRSIILKKKRMEISVWQKSKGPFFNPKRSKRPMHHPLEYSSFIQKPARKLCVTLKKCPEGK